MVSLIAAIALDGVMGIDQELPWHLPDDFRWFVKHTLGHPMIMGRKTYESLGGPLPKRDHIVLSRGAFSSVHDRVQGGQSWEQALSLAQTLPGHDEVFVIGGAAVFQQAMAHVERLYLTVVHHQFEHVGSRDVTYFPFGCVGDEHWTVVSESFHPKDARHAYAMTFYQLARANSGCSVETLVCSLRESS